MNMAAQISGADTMKKLVIDERTFWNEVKREADYHDETPQPLYLDLKTGQIFRARETVEESAPARRQSTRYSKLPRLNHSDYGRLLESFVTSDWTHDSAVKAKAREAYSPSVGRWMKQVNNPAAVGAFFQYRDAQLKRRLTHFLHCAGIEPEWRSH